MIAIYCLLLGWAVMTLIAARPVLRRGWRWLACRTGHHRETVRYSPGVLAAIALVCMDCPHSRLLYLGGRRTPSRRYALRAKGQGAA